MESNRVSRTAGRVVKAVACDVRVTAAISVFVTALVVYEYTSGTMDNAVAAGVGALGWVVITIINHFGGRRRQPKSDVDGPQIEAGESPLDESGRVGGGSFGEDGADASIDFEEPVSPFVSADDQHRSDD